jgi:hypothetical protein
VPTGSSLTFQSDANLGRILAEHGGVFVAGSLAWGVLVDEIRLDRYDLAGARDLPGRRRSDHVRPAYWKRSHPKNLAAQEQGTTDP